MGVRNWRHGMGSQLSWLRGVEIFIEPAKILVFVNLCYIISWLFTKCTSLINFIFCADSQYWGRLMRQCF